MKRIGYIESDDARLLALLISYNQSADKSLQIIEFNALNISFGVSCLIPSVLKFLKDSFDF